MIYKVAFKKVNRLTKFIKNNFRIMINQQKTIINSLKINKFKFKMKNIFNLIFRMTMPCIIAFNLIRIINNKINHKFLQK